jgi:hypothetical protein
MTTRKKNNFSITVVLGSLILFLSAVGVSCGAKKPSPKPADEPKSKQMTKKKADQFLQRVEKNNPERAVRLRKLRKNNPDKFRKTIRKELTAGARKSKTQEGKATKANSLGGGRGRGGRFAQMDRPGGGRGRGGRFAQMNRPGGGRGRGGRFAQMNRPGGGRGKGGRFGRTENPRPDESDIWGDDDWYW